jgi:hypothetical protein
MTTGTYGVQLRKTKIHPVTKSTEFCQLKVNLNDLKLQFYAPIIALLSRPQNIMGYSIALVMVMNSFSF